MGDMDIYDQAHDDLRALAAQANNTPAISPPDLYDALGNLSGAVAGLSEALPSLARAVRAAAADLDLYDSDGGDPDQAVQTAALTLETAGREALVLLGLIQQAHTQLASVGYR